MGEQHGPQEDGDLSERAEAARRGRGEYYESQGVVGERMAARDIPHYSQRDPRWRNDRMGQTASTLGAEGCAVTCAAMLLTWAGRAVTPGRLNAILNVDDGYIEGTAIVVWQKVEGMFKWFDDRPLAFAAWVSKWRPDIARSPIGWYWQEPGRLYREALSAGLPVITEVDFNPATERVDQHFVLAIALHHEGDMVWVLDPWELDATSGKYLLPLERVTGYRLFVLGRMG